LNYEVVVVLFQSVDGIDIKDINLIRLRHLISVVSQEPVLFDCSIKDNITYGLDSSTGMDEVIAAARSANIHDFISNLPSVRTSISFSFKFDSL
jgi:ABC-type multidrug transport system fused ATPase/permease subunit